MSEEELAFKKEFLLDATRLKEKKTKAYIDFVQGLQKSITPACCIICIANSRGKSD